MAKTIVANLNGGDAVTADNDLTYRVYGNLDLFTSPIDVFGSHNSDSDVTVAGGVVTVENVIDGINTSFKISSVNGSGRESPLSDEYGSFVFHDDFLGAIINTAKWNVANPDISQVHISQSDSLTMSADGTSDTTPFANTLKSNPGVDIVNDIKAFSFDIISALQNGARWGVCISKDAALTSDTSRIGIQTSSVAGQLTLLIKEASALTYQFSSAIDITTAQALKVVISNGYIEFYHWVGVSWVKKGITNAHSSIGTHFLNIFKDDETSKANAINVDNVYMVDRNFSTKYPVFQKFDPLVFTLSNMNEAAIEDYHQTSGGNWGGWAVSTEAITGDFEISVETFSAGLNDNMIGVSEAGISAGFADATNPWDALIYNNNAAAFLGREANSPITIDNPNDNNFALGDSMVLKRVGTVLTFIYRESGGDTLVHTFSNSYPNPLYMHFSCYNNQHVFNARRIL